jgi:ATP-dependent DNA helicase PIF1
MKQKIALDILQSGQNVFITGSAGTGKTYLLNQYIQYLKERKILPAIVAPTGIAASHLNGQTIHSFFGLGIREFADEWFIDSLQQKKYLNERFAKLKILIIDEVSMISPEIFSSMDKILKAFKFSNEPFGGVQVVISGDFFQLPPVSKERKVKRFAWQAEIWRDLDLNTCYLEEKFRQDENKLINILDDIRSGEISEASQTYLKDQYQKDLDISFRPTKLYTHNMDVDRINSKELEQLDGEPRVFPHTAKGTKKNIEKIFKTSLVWEELVLKIDAVVLFIKNNLEAGYINGTTGKVVDFDKDDNMPIVEIFSGRRIKLSPEDWSLENENGNIVATVSQIPLRLAWAITIHKSQGMTLDAAEIDLTRTFEPGQGYVALSRIKSIDGLKLMGINDMALRVDPLILQIDDRMKAASKRAGENLRQWSKEQLQENKDNHTESSGGTIQNEEIKKEQKKIKKEEKEKKEALKSGIIEVVKSDVVLNYIKTRDLIKSCKSISDLIEKREMTEDTVIRHLGILKQQEPSFNLDKLSPASEVIEMVKEAVTDLKKESDKKNLNELGELKLKPIFDALDEEVSYIDIKLALLFI